MITITKQERLKLAGQIMAGLCANPSVFAPNGMTGWGLVNATPADLAAYAVHLAEHVIQIIEPEKLP